MNSLNILFEPAILVIISVFVLFAVITVSNYIYIQSKLSRVYKLLHGIEKKELSYKFNQVDDFMTSDSYTNIIWEDFKKALIFPEKFYLASNATRNPSETKSDICLTIDASFFFNEETLVTSKINYKFIQIMPTILTGLGPFFTFLKMAIAFTTINFASDVNVSETLNKLISDIQIAALCSVFAVGLSLGFMLIEKLLYNRMCKKYYLAIQKEFVRLFDIVTSEQFLIDLVKESKIQNNTNEKLLKALPENFAKAVASSLNETTTPYLENILYSLNKLNESFNKGNGGDVVDKLF